MSEQKTVHFYKDDAGEWRWRVKAGNGEIVAASDEGYRRHIDAVDEATTLFGVQAVYVTDDSTEDE